MPKPIKFEKGKEYNRLTTIRLLPSRNGDRRVLCECICGNTVDVSFKAIRTGNTTSCGCYRSELVAEKNYKHGEGTREEKTPEYKAWKAMRGRCAREDPRWKGRGITVDPIWDDYELFLEEVGRKPSPEYSIERIDNDKGYTSGNVKWATDIEQARNKRSNLLVYYNGKTMCFAELCEELGIEYKFAYPRFRRGKTIEDIIEERAYYE